MQARFRQVIVNPVTVVGIVCMLVLMLFHEQTSMYYYLTIAQLVFVPVVVSQIVKFARWQSVAIVLGQLAVTSLFFITNDVYIWFGRLFILLRRCPLAGAACNDFYIAALRIQRKS